MVILRIPGRNRMLGWQVGLATLGLSAGWLIYLFVAQELHGLDIYMAASSGLAAGGLCVGFCLAKGAALGRDFVFTLGLGSIWLSAAQGVFTALAVCLLLCFGSPPFPFAELTCATDWHNPLYLLGSALFFVWRKVLRD